MRTTRHLLPALSALAATLLLSGCHGFHFGHTSQAIKPAPKRATMAAMLPVDLSKVQPNEIGKVPILEYHNLVAANVIKDYEYPAAEFRKDLDFLYAHNYRPISLSDYVAGRIDVPAGMSPVILTFDDALRGQFNYTPDGKIDPDCAVGILDAFHAAHPDWALKGTFFVLTDQDPKMPPPFYQKQYAQGKMEYLVREGFEIGNHTIHHWLRMNRWNDAKVATEIAGGVAGIHKYLPTYNVNMIAFPYGVFPKDRKLVKDGQSAGVKYHNICALAAGWEPAPSPMDKKSARYSSFPYYLPRIIPSAARTPIGSTNTIRWWLNQMELDKSLKFVSDGDPNTYTVNTIAKGELNLARLQKLQFHLRTYNGTQLVASK